MQTWIITGGTGFLGKELIRKISSHPDYRLIVLTRFAESNKLEGASNNSVRFISSDIQSIQNIFCSEAIHGVLHMATNYGRHREDFPKVIEANLQVPLLLLELAAKNSSSHFINIDSFFNKRGNNYFALPEYALTKKSFSLFLPQYAEQLEISNLFLEHVFGPNDSSEKFVPFLIRNLVTAQVDSLSLSPGDQVRDFIYVKDAVLGIQKVMEYREQGVGLHA